MAHPRALAELVETEAFDLAPSGRAADFPSGPARLLVGTPAVGQVMGDKVSNYHFSEPAGPIFGCISCMVAELRERLTPCAEPDLLSIASSLSTAMAPIRWSQQFGLQLKRDPNYGFQAIGTNGRSSDDSKSLTDLPVPQVCLQALRQEYLWTQSC